MVFPSSLPDVRMVLLGYGILLIDSRASRRGGLPVSGEYSLPGWSGTQRVSLGDDTPECAQHPLRHDEARWFMDVYQNLISVSRGHRILTLTT